MGKILSFYLQNKHMHFFLDLWIYHLQMKLLLHEYFLTA